MKQNRLPIAVSISLSIGGVFSMIVGLVWLFTPHVTDYGGLVMIEHPNSRGLPFMGLAAVLWIVSALVVLRERKRESLGHSA